MLRGIMMRRALVLLLSIGCGKAAVDRDVGRANELAQLDLAEASIRVRAMVDGCPGLARALDQLSRSTLTGRPLAGLVDDAVGAIANRCPRPLEAIPVVGTAQQLARARLLDQRPRDALAALAGGTTEPAIQFRRAELLDHLGRPAEAIVELDAGLARAPDDLARHSRRLLEVAIAARAGKAAEVARTITAAPLTDRPGLAFRAAAETPAASLDALALAATEPELVTAVADRIEQERGAVAARLAREHAVSLAPERAEYQDAAARSLVPDRIDDALAAWDRAAAIAPKQPSYRIAPIRALVAMNQLARARTRAVALAKLARAGTDVDPLLTASTAAAAIPDHVLAIELAREAKKRRPLDGRLAFTLGERLASAGDRAAAAAVFAELLVCGAHDRPWHRHEVAGKLLALATDAASTALVTSAIAAHRACTPADPTDLAQLLDALHGKLPR